MPYIIGRVKRNCRSTCKKTQYLTISRSKEAPSLIPVTLNGDVIVEADSLKILGIIFNKNLSWADQFDYLHQKCCRGMALVKKVWLSHCPSHLVWLAYQGLVMSHMLYCLPVFCDMSRAQVERLVRLERLACRWANKSGQTHALQIAPWRRWHQTDKKNCE